jgi:hypothetical protein
VKTTELLEGLEHVTLYHAGDAKVKKLRKIITPEVYANAYDLMIGLAAKGMSAQDMDLLAAQLNDKIVDEDEMGFQLKLIAKGLPPEAKAEVKNRTDWDDKSPYVYGLLPAMTTYEDKTFKIKPLEQTLNVSYSKGKWRTAVLNGHWDWKKKAFDTPEEVLTYLRAEFERRHKENARTLAFIAKEKAKT